MRYGLALLILIIAPCWGQTTTTGKAETTGLCSPAVTGSENTFTINCGIGQEQGQKMLVILNKILANQLDPDAVMRKLDEIEKEVQGVAKSIPRSRIMSEQKFQDFAAELGRQKGAIAVVLAGSSDDIFPLATQLCDAAKAANWSYTCPMGRNSIMAGEPEVEGLECYAGDWDSKDALAFKQAMKAAELLCTFISHPWKPQLTGPATITGYHFGTARTITILIGRQPR